MDLFDYICKSFLGNKGGKIKCLIDLYGQIASGLEYLHSENCAHNDIKSENILLFDQQRSAKIADFGLANNVENQKGKHPLEVAKRQVEEWQYRCLNHAAPEILHTLQSKDTPFDEQKADIFAYGVSLFEAIFSFRPFQKYPLSSDSIYKNFKNLHTFTKFYKTKP